jgi:hypothetical protein
VVEEDAVINLKSFNSADGTTNVYVNPDMVCFVRPTVDGEAGNTLIMTAGGAIFVNAPADVVAMVLGR